MGKAQDVIRRCFQFLCQLYQVIAADRFESTILNTNNIRNNHMFAIVSGGYFNNSINFNYVGIVISSDNYIITIHSLLII